MRQLITKIGYYDVYSVVSGGTKKYEVDSGKTIFIKRLNKSVPNKYRDIKKFDTFDLAKKYVETKLKQKSDKISKSLYLILIKEESTNKVFVKVGITSKKFIRKRFSKVYGYDGYIVETILRRIDSSDAEKMESIIKEKLNKKRLVKKYRPILESFSGYSECYDIGSLNLIIEVFDKEVNK
jgi:hypothetical protein